MTSSPDWILRARRFEEVAHGILQSHEGASASRVVILESSHATLERLGITQHDLMLQALRCAESELYRAAHVMAWAACMDLIMERLSGDGLKALKAVRPKWIWPTMHEIAEYIPERQIVEVLREVGLATKNEANLLIGCLHRRNECAHPSDYFPGINETLGYISELLQRMEKLQSKTLVAPSEPS